MTTEVKIKGTVEKVTIANGKAMAQVVLTIPIALATSIPLGSVSVTMQTLQSALFDKKDTNKQVFGGKKQK